MLTDIRLWKRYPLLCLIRFMQNTIRTTALLFFFMVISIITTSNRVQNLPVEFIAVSLGLNYLLMLYFGAKIRRYKAWLYPIMFILNPFFNWTYMVYGIFTAGQRTWGGPRADAGAADADTTPQQAIEHAKATGDDLNVIPETFKPAVEARHPGRRKATTLQPSAALEAVFAPSEDLESGWYKRHADSELMMPDPAHNSRMRHARPVSFDSAGSSDYSIPMPRRLVSMLGEEDRRYPPTSFRARLNSTHGNPVSPSSSRRVSAERGLPLDNAGG